MLLIGAYRDNEVDAAHLLQAAVAELARRRPSAVQTIELRPLSEHSVSQLVADTLRCEPADEPGPGGDGARRRPHGNPFFVNELLGMLYREGAFHFLVRRRPLGLGRRQGREPSRSATTWSI